MLEAGAAAPEVRLHSLEGAEFALFDQLKTGPLLLVFFKVSCPTCQFTLPFLDRLHSGERTGSPRIIGVSQDRAEATREFNRQFEIHFPVLLDHESEKYPASNAYHIESVPSLFLIETTGKIAASWDGFHRMELERLGERFGRSPFQANERVPEMRPG